VCVVVYDDVPLWQIVAAGDWLQGPYVYYLYSSTDSTRATSAVSSSPGSGPPCSSAPSSDLSPINSACFSPFSVLLCLVHLVGTTNDEVGMVLVGQGAEEGVHHLLHQLHPELHHQALSRVQDSDDWARARWNCHVAALLRV
jgi:hypothetical protein